jgi:phosphatidylserine decarboxylase
VLLSLKHRGANIFACDARFAKGEEMGWFQHGSTIIVFAPNGFSLCENVREGAMIRMGQPLMQLPEFQEAAGTSAASRQSGAELISACRPSAM